MAEESVVVIGSGPAGAMAAHELVRQGVKVTMLEAGTAEPSGVLVRAGGRNLFRRVPELRNDPSTYVSSGHASATWLRCLEPGGLTNQWTGAVPRYAPGDFFDGERIDSRYRWPLDYDDLVPYYERAERLLRITACPEEVPLLPRGWMDYERRLPEDWQRVAGVARRRGQGLTALPLADGPDYLFTLRGTAFNSYRNIAARLRTSPHFRLQTGCRALALEWSGSARRVQSVRYHRADTGHEDRISARAVVVACGCLSSTKLLFDSACPDFPDGLGNAEGLLGKYLHDHPAEWWSIELERPIARLSPAGYLTRRPFELSKPLMSTSWTIGVASRRDQVRSLLPTKSDRVGVKVFGTMVPSKSHFVQPHAERRDEFNRPQLAIRMDFDEEVVDNVISARQHFVDLMDEAGYPCRLEPVVPQLCPGESAHFGGTVRMHRDPRFGVLDEWNRVRDASNVIVTDASCFTTGPEKNPTLTSMALSARAAERLAHDLARGCP
jgi:choline dehydrogenase-like flavoprotein